MVSLLSFSPLKSAKACAATTTESLDQKFGRKGIKFSESGTVELSVRNGSSVKLEIANGHITSYKPKVYWKDDGYEEVLHTLPPSSSSSSSRGGIALVVDDLSSPSNPKATTAAAEWTVMDADSDSIDAVQVELGCVRGCLDIRYVVSLYPLSMAAAVIVKNTGRKPVDLATAILSHLKVKKRGGSGVQGLKGCSYCTHPPLSSPFQILSPSEATKTEDPGFFSFGWEPENKAGVWSVQDAPITVLRHKLSRVYAAPPPQRSDPFHTTAPSKYETIDQGRELFFRVIRMGFEEIYLSSPGSFADKYGNGYFICTGPTSMLVPVTVNPGEEWRGAQVIEHDNL
ncbi:photosynthetic NDH subunit of subcomplex B 2, chloroplastic-like [Salvia splendens]|uniref:photosynthetic NDH subunit of subcomplex B 2, chloroplastic-like n=1 Tax=Salvia splendens TaxID=180675 RepID=UPI001C25EC54|nr:photosynthetic NDH subunit of subcomplex B 2, chloroplastic-like [Salvia splendens]